MKPYMKICIYEIQRLKEAIKEKLIYKPNKSV